MPPPDAPVNANLQLPPWSELSLPQVLRWPLGELPSASDRMLTRLFCLLASRQVTQVAGAERILPHCDPFLLVANHSSRREAVYLTAILLLARSGRVVRFLADWNFRLIPGVGRLYEGSGAITLTRKSARPRFLNLLKRRFEPNVPPLDQAREHLMRGGSVGIFPEGTVNRSSGRLLRGHRAAARLSLETAVPIVPTGIRFEQRHKPTGLLDSSSPISIHFGEPMMPDHHAGRPIGPRTVTDWNRRLMTRIGQLCGKDAPGARGRPE